MSFTQFPEKEGLYDPANEKDSCGVGFVVNINGLKSHTIIRQGIEVLKNLLHRGAVGGDMETGDGAGILIQMPDEFFRKEAADLEINLPAAGNYGVGVVFLSRDPAKNKPAIAVIEQETRRTGLNFLGWRNVPVNPEAIKGQAREEMPEIRQFFIGMTNPDSVQLEIKLYILRRVIENTMQKTGSGKESFYIPSLSSRTIVYKGLFMATQFPRFYQDLNDEDLKSALAIVHQRYSTNTFPSWQLAQPFRYLAHNGEINTLRGNLNQMRSRESLLASPVFGADLKRLLPIIDASGSDSACLDNIFELLFAAGRSLDHVLMMLIPQAWGEKYYMGPDQRGFFEYHSGLMEPWDGPAAVVASNGKQVAAILDRNGLRPARYTITKDGFMVLASEAGVLDFTPANIQEKGALRPGQIIMVDTEKRRVLKEGEIKIFQARRQPFRRWVEENKITIQELFGSLAAIKPDKNELFYKQQLFAYTREDLQLILTPMASTGNEPVGSMGYDAPLAVFSGKPQLLYAYFKQLFAQITNPAIDPIREELVMSLMTYIGNPANILSEIPQNSRMIKLKHPILSNGDMERLRNISYEDFRSYTLQIGFEIFEPYESRLKAALDLLAARAEEAVDKGYRIIILSDKSLEPGYAPIPALLAVSAVNQRLAKTGKRSSIGLVVESGEPREVMHMALLLGNGATAINPYLAFDAIINLALEKQLQKEISPEQALTNYIKSLNKGLLKVMSKMGISTLRSYRGARIFQAIGLNDEVIETYFPGTGSGIGGIGMQEISSEVIDRYNAAHDEAPGKPHLLDTGGYYKFRKDGERHLWTPEAISNLQQATRKNDYNLFKQYTALIDEQAEKQITLRGMFRFKKQEPVPLAEVEPVSEIIKRFVTGAMSFGSISREAHETLAAALNRMGLASNSGEGGEDPERYKPGADGVNLCSATKQVASGRFGVTIEYLVNARELQIKIAQGAKPGEGGQLPGHKVNREIARVRYSTPGVSLISPPPHHDIYSIEDIAQLIFDLKNANPGARISVKLVSEVGVGTIAAGVAKARADMVLISGFDGGTGAAPLSSIRHTGGPWELGLAETQQTLVLNNLRRKIRLQVDGNMKTGRDVVVAALLGAEEFGFATAALVVCGCVMMRKCHENTCPVGVATQDSELRKRYTGKPEYIMNFFHLLAQDIREHMAALGFRRMDDMIGKSDLLDVNGAVQFWKARGLDFSRIFRRVDTGSKAALICREAQDHGLENVLDNELIKLAAPALEKKQKVIIRKEIRNIHRTIGTMLSGRIAMLYGNAGLPEDTIQCCFSGSAGQSFGAFCAGGLTLHLEGEANDYLGKGLSGGKIIVKPFAGIDFDPSRNIIAGNVLLYGATAGEVYICGRAGERFAIRNSGAHVVVEGVGDHGCEYMTGGRVVILGETGVNFAAGMSGGIAYIYDPDRVFDNRCNLDMIDLDLVCDAADIDELKTMIDKHLQYTGSSNAKYILDNWEGTLPYFIKVFPTEYRRALGRMSKEDEATEREGVVHG